MCYCADGMALKPDDKRTCIDFNECSSWGYCDQICTNKQYGYTCSCQAGFTLTGKQMCRANNSESARLIVSSNKRLFSMKTDGSDIKLIATTSISPVAFDSYRNKIFWANAHDSDKREFWESDLSGENKRSIPLRTTFSIASLTYDWIANNLYYIDDAAGILGIFSLDSRRQSNIITSDLTRMISITLDPLVGYMFVALWGYSYERVNGIYRAFMDGSNMVYFKTSNYTFPRGITADVISKRIYFIDSHFDQVLTFDYNGLNRFEIIAGGKYIPSPVAITHFESHLFWADLHKGKIMKMNKNGSISTLTEIYHNTSEIPERLKIFHSSLQPQGRNPCKQAKCQHICVVTHTSDNDGLGYRCLCEIGFIPDSNQINCTRVTKFILVSKRNTIEGVPLDRKFSSTANAILPVTNTFLRYSHIKSLDYTSSDQTIYFSDAYSRTVLKFNLNTSELKIVFHEYVSDISVDWMLRNLYMANRLGITVVRIDNVEDKRVIISNETSVTSIVCHPYKGLIFFASRFYTKLAYIGRAFADGSNVKHIRRHELGYPASLTIDFKADHLYWSDFSLKRIQRSDLDGNNVQTLGITLRTPVRIFVYGDDLYLLSYFVLIRTKKTGDSPLETLATYKMYTMDLKIYDKDLQKIEASNPCIQRNGDCTHFCFAVPMTQDILHGELGRHCGCPYGMKLDTDLRTCINHTEFEPPKECPPSRFQCKNKRCISHYRVCNLQDDCFDNSDEVNCTSPSRQCSLHEFKCASGKCIPNRWICDGYKDCPDNTDEKDCKYNCSSFQFRCNNGFCIHRSRKCNSYTDCTDGSDEGAFCANHTCLPYFFKCDGYKCLSQSFLCNGRRNCRDGSDERNCPEAKCSPYQWKCPTSNICIHKMRHCDGVANCEDGSDEVGCNVTTAEGCREGYFRCLGGSCLPNNWHCDGHKDCESGSDENSTCITKPCPAHRFRCNTGLCIPKSWVCDHMNDCGDNSDEGTAQNCPSPKFRCSYREWQCPGGHQICISLSKICDGKTDCPGGTDESATCNSNSCAINKGGCAFRCLQTPFGAQCLCPVGQDFNSNETCVDLNECEPPGVCSQHCLNLEGSYKCSCDTGYQSERNLCLAIENTTLASLIVIGLKSFTNVSLNLQPYEEINIADAKRIIASSIDIPNQTIYFSDARNKVISRIKTNGSDQTVIVQTGMTYVAGLAVDWIGRNLYWIDSWKRTIEVSDLEGDHRMILLKLNLSRPMAIEIDPREEFMVSITKSLISQQ
ncbi:low-density lipoprotein receptor-related protein 2-like, partial [Octopus sinensis]|uniref:Low-density lipoprotein receptor-related protein 2-like n=1 Tax=Octopus sinensis TaxID=2607531 RepID=A0A7E6EM94_9MOLL